jgi:hypothetical protein
MNGHSAFSMILGKQDIRPTFDEKGITTTSGSESCLGPTGDRKRPNKSRNSFKKSWEKALLYPGRCFR